MHTNQELNILLIEDEREVRDSYVDMFGFLGHTVDTAENGRQGLEKLDVKHYDIVVTDLNMPIMDGLETMRHIKKIDPEIEVIVITGFATIENAIRAMKQGAFDYITKPVSFEHVKIVINKCIQKIFARRENQSLRDSNSALKELNELKDKFITITNHELRTPLAVLRGYFDLLKMEISSSTNEDVNEYTSIISHTITEMTDMVESMHDLSSFNKYVSVHEKEKIDANILVTDVYKEARILFENREITFSIEKAPEELFIFVDVKMLHKAVRELIQNALKYTKEGGQVTLCIKSIPARNQVFISVQDTGIGISPEKHELIFEPFFELQDSLHHSTSKTEFMGGGIGVGLSLANEIVQSNNGEIALESTQGKGSIFTIILPVIE